MMRASSPAMHHLYVPYQVDFTPAKKGRHVGMTKRRISWKFGFASLKEAVVDGRQGVECRGSEHELQFTWSLSSGKRQVEFDGQIVHFSIVKSSLLENVVFEHSFPISTAYKDDDHGTARHTIQIICFARTPSHAGSFHQFDVRVDGVSYFDFLKLYELGSDKMWSMHSNVLRHFSPDRPPLPEERRRRPFRTITLNYNQQYGKRLMQQTGGDAPHSRSEESRMVAAAKVESMRSFREQQQQQVHYFAPAQKPLATVPEGNHGYHSAPASIARDFKEETSVDLMAFDDSNLRNNLERWPSEITIDDQLDRKHLDDDDITTASFNDAYQHLHPDQQQYQPGFAMPPPPPPPQAPQFSPQPPQQQMYGNSSNMSTMHMSQTPSQPSFAVPPHLKTNSSFDTSTTTGGMGGYATPMWMHPGAFSPAYETPPPPTWEQTQTAFTQQQQHHQQQQHQQQYPYPTNNPPSVAPRPPVNPQYYAQQAPQWP